MSELKQPTSIYIANSFLWSTISKLINVIVQFISVPILLIYWGRDNYGLIALAMAVNAYLQLLDLGINTGAVKFFSEWISLKKNDLLNKVFRTSLSFYGIIGLINAAILIILSYKGLSLFSLSSEQELIFRNLLLTLAVFSIFNWSTSVFNQLLTANEDLAYVQKILTLRSLLTLAITFITVYLKLSISTYFLLYIIINSIFAIPFFWLKLKKDRLIFSFMPAFYWKDFRIILKYSIAILAMGIFQMSALKLRPVILSIFSTEGSGMLADYRILETITLLVISIGGTLMSVFLPKTSKLWMGQDKEKIEKFIYSGTKYTSILSAILCVPILLCAGEIIELYVGTKFVHLSVWLNIWLVSILLFLHNSPVASLVLASGRTKMLVWSSAIACISSLIINAYLSPLFGIGAAIIGYFMYVIIQMSFYYLYFNNRVLGLNSIKIFKKFIIPTIIAFIAAILIWIIDIQMPTYLFLQIVVKCILWGAIFVILMFLFKIISIKDIQRLVNYKRIRN